MSKTVLYLMLGYPGAGKTTTAKIIHELTGAVHLSSDLIRIEMFPKPTFSEDEHQELYKEIDQQTKNLLQQGKSVIYDANLNRYKHRQDKYEICKRTGAHPVLVLISTPKEIAKLRASHDSRRLLWTKHESPEQMFDRIAGIIELPKVNESPVVLDGTKITTEYVKHTLGL